MHIWDKTFLFTCLTRNEAKKAPAELISNCSTVSQHFHYLASIMGNFHRVVFTMNESFNVQQ